MYDTVEITSESDEHGEVCERCLNGACATNIHIVNEDGDGETLNTCEAADCINGAIEGRHHGHREVLVEISVAPMPWAQSTPAAPTVGPVAA